jgi:hypothetical protein
VLKLVIKKKYINSNPFALININVKILSNFQKEWCTFGRKKGHLKKIRIVHSQNLNALNMQKHFLFVSNFEHVNFTINGKYSKNIYDNPNYHLHVIFQTYKNVVLNNIHSLGWLLLLCFYPNRLSLSMNCMVSQIYRVTWCYELQCTEKLVIKQLKISHKIMKK